MIYSVRSDLFRKFLVSKQLWKKQTSPIQVDFSSQTEKVGHVYVPRVQQSIFFMDARGCSNTNAFWNEVRTLAEELCGLNSFFALFVLLSPNLTAQQFKKVIKQAYLIKEDMVRITLDISQRNPVCFYSSYVPTLTTITGGTSEEGDLVISIDRCKSKKLLEDALDLCRHFPVQCDGLLDDEERPHYGLFVFEGRRQRTAIVFYWRRCSAAVDVPLVFDAHCHRLATHLATVLMCTQLVFVLSPGGRDNKEMYYVRQFECQAGDLPSAHQWYEHEAEIKLAVRPTLGMRCCKNTLATLPFIAAFQWSIPIDPRGDGVKYCLKDPREEVGSVLQCIARKPSVCFLQDYKNPMQRRQEQIESDRSAGKLIIQFTYSPACGKCNVEEIMRRCDEALIQLFEDRDPLDLVVAVVYNRYIFRLRDRNDADAPQEHGDMEDWLRRQETVFLSFPWEARAALDCKLWGTRLQQLVEETAAGRDITIGDHFHRHISRSDPEPEPAGFTLLPIVFAETEPESEADPLPVNFSAINHDLTTEKKQRKARQQTTKNEQLWQRQCHAGIPEANRRWPEVNQQRM